MAPTERPQPKSSNDADKLEVARKKLLKQREELNARLNTIEAKAKTQKRKDDTREKIIIGAVLIADAAIHPETRDLIEGVLRKAVTSPRDREFLQNKGWLN